MLVDAAPPGCIYFDGLFLVAPPGDRVTNIVTVTDLHIRISVVTVLLGVDGIATWGPCYKHRYCMNH